MEHRAADDKTFDKIDFTQKSLQYQEYDNCSFINCNLSGADLSDIRFTECRFTSCNLSLAILNKTAFSDVLFKDCKMLGLRFDTCSTFILSFSFDNCILSHSSFYGLKIKKTIFTN